MVAKRTPVRVGGRSRMLPKFQPYYDFVTKTTKYGKDVWIGELPRKAKRK